MSSSRVFRGSGPSLVLVGILVLLIGLILGAVVWHGGDRAIGGVLLLAGIVIGALVIAFGEI